MTVMQPVPPNRQVSAGSSELEDEGGSDCCFFVDRRYPIGIDGQMLLVGIFLLVFFIGFVVLRRGLIG